MPTAAPVRRRITAAVLSALALAACSGAAGTPQVSVTGATSPEPAGANGAVYLTLTNDGDADDRLVGASADAAVAAQVEMHETSTQDGTMSMQPVDGVDVPAGGSAVFEPGGLHIMLVGVDQGLTAGDTFELRLSFEQSDDQTVTVEVVPLVGGASEGTHDMGSEPMDTPGMGSEQPSAVPTATAG